MLLYIIFAHIIELTALLNAVCLYNALFALGFNIAIYANGFCFPALSLSYRHLVCLFQL